MSTGLPAHPAWIIYQLTLGAVYCCALFWRAPTKTEHEIFFLIAFLAAICVGFWASYRLLTNSIAAIHRRTIWANVWWWLFLFSFPQPLFLIVFHFPGKISICLAFVGFFSLIAVAVLSDKFLPYPKGTIIDDFDESMAFPLSAFHQPQKQELEIQIHHITPVLQAVLDGSAIKLCAALEEHPEHLNTAYAQNGNTPLHVAALNGQTEIVKLLLEQPGLDTTLKNNEGKTAADLAQEKNFMEIADLLK